MPSLRWIGATVPILLLPACATEPAATPDDDEEPEVAVAADLANVAGFRYGAFSDPTTIDNPWMPLQVGTQIVLEGFTIEDDEEIPHRIEVVVTDLAKEINGVTTRVLLETDISDGNVEEVELAFRAQDDSGSVWHMGEYTEVYEDTELVGGRLWAQGTPETARAGIIMPGDPETGTRDFAQGFAPPPYNWTDRGRVADMGTSTTVEAGAYDDVLVIEEYNEEEPGAIQTKHYAREVGIVRIGWAGEDPEMEEMELVERRMLSPAELAEAREVALDIQARAMSYAGTAPLQAEP